MGIFLPITTSYTVLYSTAGTAFVEHVTHQRHNGL